MIITVPIITARIMRNVTFTKGIHNKITLICSKQCIKATGKINIPVAFSIMNSMLMVLINDLKTLFTH